ncbi:flagellar operon protein [Hypnocyclicus thermotrophus]|uniref:Flagellar operon protein n=1 Tax=Hypnocyclicus thermotrophus TaxID=1627895 RepID=A0AA46DXJ3_9FUSO|nr:TIGR02530 family flagellar biosynthesis protein [Hypnocyclicus thermotrophus]TDT68549.1 flagellar operon protein [Hypnocyclicus thermotrophus]
MARLLNSTYIQGLKSVNNNIDNSNKNNHGNKPSVAFENVLENEKKLKFSAHAQKRIESRRMEIKEEELKKVQEGVKKLREKGCRDSVVIAKNRAYVISIKNNTVVTIVDEPNLKDNLFTNIDSLALV